MIVNIHELKCPVQKKMACTLKESKLSRSNVILTMHPIKHKSTMLKEPTDKFKLEHLRDALLKTLFGQ